MNTRFKLIRKGDIKMEFNTNQKEAIHTIDGNMVVIAAAGSGKTSVLTYRILNMVKNYGIDPTTILAVTFSKKAKESIEQRLGKLGVASVNVETFHSLALKIITSTYGYGKYKDVITGLQFERLASASGPTFGEIRRPSDGQIPQKIVFVACAGSRDPAKGIPYCSKICCMYTAKHAMLYQHKVHGGESYVFYMDIRAGGKNYEEFVRRAIEEDGVNYVRGRVARIYEKNGKLIVKGVDTLLGASPVEIEADMVVLATAGVANKGAEELAQKMHISYDPYQFFAESHPKLKPVETNTAGIYLAGACQAPKDIPETVGMASGAAVKVAGLFSQANLVREPLIAVVNRTAPPLFSTCVGCFMCQTACPYQAIEREEIKDRNGNIF